MTVRRYQAHFLGLDGAQSAFLANTLVPILGSEYPPDPAALYDACLNTKVDHARIILQFSDTFDPVGIKTLEALVGRPIQHGPPPRTRPMKVTKITLKPHRTPAASVQLRVASVHPNPKRPGSESHKRYEFWAVGLTVQECLDKGLSKGDVAHDTSKGYVVLE